MSNKLKLPVLAVSALALVAFAAPGSMAKPSRDGVRVGVLTCKVEGGPGFVFGSSKELNCRFEGSGGRSERYEGEINKFGIDVGVTGPATLTWAVVAPTEDVRRGALEGNYVGASAEASAGVGAGANLLVGGSDETISLQPLSVSGGTGVNAALAVSELVLRGS
ncbi:MULTISPECIES: DUF992 domain-containing protein [Rhodomicrobium]|uniref:DUF992 domain-containing protein n=1 Tax=Rhodomicrobium TaxID=1068 RepID=UPI000B4B0EC4|nr:MULTISPECIES: DUF992 domain-containing protein [Rhodomicrobium]